jgi:hypothetical protein
MKHVVKFLHKHGLDSWRWVVMALLLVPSMVLLLAYPDIPRFGKAHDDSLYFVTAKALAQGDGYRILSLPEEPAQTKYPPLYPLLLSIAWRLVPEFPRNLTVAAWLSWTALPVVLVLLWRWFAGLGLEGWPRTLLLAAFALNPYILLFSTQLMSEMWFLALVLVSMLMLERETGRWALLAGVAAGLAYLTRTAGLALLIGGAAWLWRRDRTAALRFVGGALPLAIVWTVWVQLNRWPTDEPELIYYLDYLRYERYVMSLPDLPVILWKNVDGLLSGLGGLLLPKITWTPFEKIAQQVLAVAAMSGVVRMVRASEARLYAGFAAISIVMLVGWHFPPNERFVLPLLPLLLVGLWREGAHLWAMLRAGMVHRKRDQRVAARMIAAFATLVLALVIVAQGYFDGTVLAADAREQQSQKRERMVAYAWLREHTPRSARVLSSNDPLLYLHTGRHAISRPLPPFLWYREDRVGQVRWMSEPMEFARRHKLDYFEFSGVDVNLGIEDAESDAIAQRIAASPKLTRRMAAGKATLYEFALPESASGELHRAEHLPVR